MKKRVCFIGGLLLLLGSLMSCSDSDKDDASAVLQMYGASYHLSDAVLWEYNPNTVIPSVPYIFKDMYVDESGTTITDNVEGYTVGTEKQVLGNFTLSLYEEGLVFNPALEAVYGSAACICFHLSSSKADRLVPGRYTYNTNREALTFYAYVSADYDTETTVKPAEITEGEVNVSGDEGNYQISFKTKTSFGGDISGFYEGPVHRCKVEQNKSASYENIRLAGLLDTVKVEYFDPASGYRYETRLDISNGAAFLSTTTGLCSYAKDKANADIALLWDTSKQAFKFESPIRMRSHLGHDDTYNYACHTIYMKAPDTFTDADYDNLETTGFEFTVEEKEVILPINNWKSCYVFFETGNGIKGVMKLKNFVPIGERQEENFGTQIYYPVNPVIVMDMKIPVTYNNLRIR